MKKIHLLFLIVVLLIFTTGCSNESQGPSEENPGGSAEVMHNEKEDDQKEIEIEKGETVVIEEYCEFTVEESVFSKRIDPKNPADFYTYYEIEEPGNIYLDIVINIKSLLESEKTSDEFANVKVVYNDKYEYNTFSAIEENNRSNFTYTNITSIEPLKSGTLHFLAELPEEASEEDGKITVLITINGKDYKYIMK